MRLTAKIIAVKDIDGRFYYRVKNLLPGRIVVWTLSDTGYNAARTRFNYKEAYNLSDSDIRYLAK